MREVHRERRAVITTAVVTVFSYAGMATSLLTVPLYLKWLGVDAYGLMLTALAFMGYLAFSGGGVNWGSILLIGRAHGLGDHGEIAKVFRHGLLLSSAAGVIALAVAGSVYAAARLGLRLPMFRSDGSGDLLVLVVGVQCATTLVCNAVYAVFIGLQEGYWAAVYEGSARLLGAVGGVSVAYVYREPAPALGVQSLAVILCGLCGTAHVFRRYPWLRGHRRGLDRAQFRAQLRIAAKNLGLQIARTIQGTAPVMVISSVAGAASVPLYTVPATLLNGVFNVFFSWNASLQPAYGSAWASGDREWVATTFARSLRWVTLIAAVATAGFAVGAPDVVRVWTAGTLAPGRLMCLSVAAVLIVQVASASVQFCLTGINQHRTIAVIELIHAMVALLSAIAAVRWFGITAIGVGMGLAYLATSARYGFRDLIRRLEDRNVVPEPRWLLGVCLSAAAGTAVGLVVEQAWPGASGAVALVGAVLAAALAGLCSILLFAALRLQSLDGWTRVLRRRPPLSSS